LASNATDGSLARAQGPLPWDVVTPGRKPWFQVCPPSVLVAKPMSLEPPSKKRPVWKADTRVDPKARVSGSTSVACALDPPEKGSLLSCSVLGGGGGDETTREIVVVWTPLLVPLPVTVTLVDPGGVEDDVVSVSVEVLPVAMVVGLNDAVAPLGKPDALNVTPCTRPLVTAVEMVLVPLPPGLTVTDVGLADMEKSLGAAPLTTSDTVVEWVALAPVPVIVIVLVPAGVDGDVPSVSVEPDPDDTVDGLNDAVTPFGRVPTLSDTLCDDPLVTAVEIVLVPLPPGLTVTDVGLADIEKSLVARVTVRNSGYVCVANCPVATRVI